MNCPQDIRTQAVLEIEPVAAELKLQSKFFSMIFQNTDTIIYTENILELIAKKTPTKLPLIIHCLDELLLKTICVNRFQNTKIIV